ncbi:hypothetical protein GF327_02145 [Candidatus Woesearchaeota archaeon]|nr:hypothetical protein [Candidatus Woesearchaeota archaeon]
MKKDVSRIIVSEIFGVMIFLIILLISTILFKKLNLQIAKAIIHFVNNNALLIITISLFFSSAKVIKLMKFPANLFYPVLNAFAFLYFIKFFFKLLEFVDVLTGANLFWIFEILEVFAYPFCFILIVILGYIKYIKTHVKPLKKKKDSKEVSWEEIGSEFKKTLLELIKSAGKPDGSRKNS